MTDIANRQFDMDDQRMFAGLSGDCNPLHLDPQAARRTMFGQPIVHGVHLLLWSLEQWARRDSSKPIKTLDVRLLKPVFLDETVRLKMSSAADDLVTLVCLSGEIQVCAVKIGFGDLAATISSGEVWFPADRMRMDAPLDLTFAEIDGRAGQTVLDITEAELIDRFPSTAERLGTERTAALLGLTRLVGMECPGLNSIFSSVSVRLDGPDANHLTWRVAKANPRMSLITLAVSGGGIEGSIVAFYRPTPQAPLSVADIAAAVGGGHQSERRALIVGGSRGLGRTTAIMLASLGADVAVTYRSGREEAESVVADIAALGHVAQTVELDTAMPGAGIDSLAASGFVANEIYYFATPHIFVRKKALFEEPLFASFVDSYVSGLMRVVRALRAQTDGPIRIFVPSSEALNEPLAELFEYTVAKAAAEALADLLPRFDPRISVVQRRLPRLPTDQTRTLMAVPSADPIATLKEVCDAMAPSPLELA